MAVIVQRKQPPYKPSGSKAVRPSRPRPHTIQDAYERLSAEMFGVKEEVFRQALRQAQAADRGHEAEYTEGMNRFDPFTRDYLNDMARENVLMWLQAFMKPRATRT